jgi:ABC-type transport system substrate-binding protein
VKSRRTFLSAVAAGSVGLALGASDAATADAPAAAATSAPAPSAAATAYAATMRSFDPHLTDADLTAIARAVDANLSAARQLHPKPRPLQNSDEPAVRFAAPIGGDA